MPDRRDFSLFALAAIGSLSAACNRVTGNSMQEVKFDVGKGIVETAKASGVPSFQVLEVAGYVMYDVVDVPREIQFRYTRPGHEVTWNSVFAFGLSADRDNALLVHGADLQLRSRYIETDEQAQAFVEQTIAQFQKGMWKRYADSDWDVLLTGRSSILDEQGKIARSLPTIDPAYKIPREDWSAVIAGLTRWIWVGDGVLATLDVANSPGNDGKPAYRMNLDFEVLDRKLKRDAANEAQRLKEGDAKGWGSTAEAEADKKKRAVQIKRLIDNAIKRGDSVIAPLQN